MKVKNQSCIRHLSLRQLKASQMRNLIAVFAIALTTLLFTALFTIAMSLNSSYEEYSFRQTGGYCHGTFKDVDEEKITALSSHSKIKEYGLRQTIGFCTEEPFAKIPAEISWMDANCTKWSYAVPTTGRMPEERNEIAMDTKALEKLGVPAKLGEQIILTYQQEDKQGTGTTEERTDVFTLVGFWNYDTLSPVHYINISEFYAQQVEAEHIAAGGSSFRKDMNVMLASSINIQGVMENIDTDLGYQWEERDAENCVRIGVNWGYTASEAGANLDLGLVASIVAFLLLVVFTGYLIIYNIFRISVSNDVRFYGLLKTIGTTPKQIEKIIRWQACCLSILGIPFGLLGGYGVGALLLPAVMSSTTLGSVVKLSVSPLIFLGATLFSLITVLFSCSRPGRMAAKISPVEAVRYTETTIKRKKRHTTKGATVFQMAIANLDRSRTKLVLVVVSLSLAVILLNCVYSFTGGFDMEKYLSKQLSSDFVLGTTEYFRYNGGSTNAALSEDVIKEIQENTQQTIAGAAYSGFENIDAQCWMPEEQYKKLYSDFYSEEEIQMRMSSMPQRDSMYEADIMLEGLDEALLEKLTVFEGDITPLFDPDNHAIAIAAPVDDYGNRYGSSPEVGSKFTVTYVEEGHFYDSRTGELCTEETPAEFVEYRIVKFHDVEYTVCAVVNVPYDMGYRFSIGGLEAVLTGEALRKDSGEDIYPLVYVFDTPNEEAEKQAEAFLAEYTKGESSEIMYESKALVREDFEGFRDMFLLLGGVLSFVVGVIGILNFFNGILTGILSRRREFAMLQSVGMTGKQLKTMLVYEGVFYSVAAILFSLILSLVMEPLAGHLMENMFWFFRYKFTILPILLVAPAFLLLGMVLPLAVYHFVSKKSIVERLRENG